jgi:hypothetical protein
MGVQLLDYDFHTHPSVESKESFGMGVQLLDYVFQTHPNRDVSESFAMGVQLLDFEYGGQAADSIAAPLYLSELPKKPAAVYSLERLIQSATLCLRVRRSNDDAELDIGFTSGTINVTALQAFVGSNSGYVVQYYDQSGGNYHLDLI